MTDSILTPDGRSVSHERIDRARFLLLDAEGYLCIATTEGKPFFFSIGVEHLAAAAAALGYELRPLPDGGQ